MFCHMLVLAICYALSCVEVILMILVVDLCASVLAPVSCVEVILMILVVDLCASVLAPVSCVEVILMIGNTSVVCFVLKWQLICGLAVICVL